MHSWHCLAAALGIGIFTNPFVLTGPGDENIYQFGIVLRAAAAPTSSSGVHFKRQKGGRLVFHPKKLFRGATVEWTDRVAWTGSVVIDRYLEISLDISVPLPPDPTPRYNATSSVYVCAYLFMLMKSLLRDLQRERLLTRSVAGV